MTDGRTTLTYADLMAAADRIAAALAPRITGPDCRVGIAMRRRPGLVSALLGILKAGAAYVPLDPDYPADRLDFITHDAGLDVVIADDGRLPFASTRPLDVIDPEHLPPPSSAPLRQAGPDDLAYVIYTSGSTGRPKGVVIAHRNALARLAWARDTYSAADLSGVLASTSICFDLSVFEIFAPLGHGGRVVIADTLLALPRLPVAAGVTLVNTVPSLLRELLRHHDLPASVTTVNLAGEPLPPALLEALRADPRGLRIFNLYGPSEDTTYSTGAALHDLPAESGPVPIGHPLPGTRALVRDRAGRLRPDGLAGELHLGGAGLARGYLGRPEDTEARFRPDPFAAASGERLYRTGDRVRRRADGGLDFLGRLDHQVKLRGFRIETGEIEHHLEALPDVAEAVVTVSGAPGDPDRRLVAHVAAKAGASLEAAGLRAALAALLPAHLVPDRWCLLATLPHLPNGKIDRAALPAVEAAEASGVRVAPRDAAESRLAAIWSEVLGVADIGVEDGFFDLGGHSLLAIRIIARIEESFGVDLPLKALFRSPTVAGLAREIAAASRREDDARPQIVPDPAGRHAPFPLTDIQHAYWLGRSSVFELGSVGAHAYREFDVTGLDPDMAEAAILRLIARHEMLSAVVTPEGEQRVLPETPDWRLPVADLRDVADADRQLAEIRARLSHHVFSPDRWPLFHVEAARLDGGRLRLFVSFDVLIGDAWSFRLLAREFADLVAGRDLPPLALSFRDCVLAEKAAKQGLGFARALDHWQARLDDLPPAPDLPMVRTPAQLAEICFRRRSVSLPREDWRAFRSHAASAGLTPTAAVLAVFAEVLARWSRRPAFTLNLTLFNRPPLHPEIGGVVGDFTSSMLLGVDMSGVEAFVDRAKRLQDRLWDDLDHRAVGGIRVLRDLARRQNRPVAGLMPVVFTSTLNQTAPQATDRPFASASSTA
ncbi:amino acid adenylation domain-containing protein [Methylobrevis pamukkalensis]|uniref:L-cysteine--[L-cysteinyl-carrier protein] ligase n=1 Tax=Methylobrevis pamukkalensis TaxID=1439726 RepID=A0A1E3H757_9HYPH|nr:amino acid adenylation domain-containing protein [Methylobrevis pamukkalensis]ODN72168.1 Linear gramicidin synthase subunit B [Methylobrevis pamukkalensis]